MNQHCKHAVRLESLRAASALAFFLALHLNVLLVAFFTVCSWHLHISHLFILHTSIQPLLFALSACLNSTSPMSSGVKQPIGQVRLTNIVFVRYDVGGQRFEIACFPNKVLDWRRKVYVAPSSSCILLSAVVTLGF